MLISLFGQAENVKLNNDSTRQLSKKMCDFFTEVLKNNYNGTNEQDLYEQFLTDYFEAWNKGLGVPDLILKVDKDKLTGINNDLLKRDLSHYYYFFQEIILLKPEDNIEKAKELFNRYPEIPITLVSPGIIVSRQKLLYADFYETHNVQLAFQGGFIKDIQQYNLKTVLSLNKTMKYARELSFFNFSAFLTKTEAKDELQYEIVREIVAVVFWKYLCLQAKVDFYELPNNLNMSFKW